MFARRRLFGALALGAAIGTFATTSEATSIRLCSIEELAQRADAIVRAVPVTGEVHSKWNDKKTLIVTETRLKVVESWSGPFAVNNDITIETLGGDLPAESVSLIVPGTPAFVPGEEVVVFLAHGEDGAWRVLDMGAGKFEVQRPAGEEAIVTRRDLGGDGVQLSAEVEGGAGARRGIVAAPAKFADLKSKAAAGVAFKRAAEKANPPAENPAVPAQPQGQEGVR